MASVNFLAKLAELNFCEIIEYSSRKLVEAFLLKTSSFKNQLGVNQKYKSSRCVGVNRKNKILQSFLEAIKSHKQIL